MFGADTALMFDAIQMVGIAAAVTGGGVYVIMRRRRSAEDRDGANKGASNVAIKGAGSAATKTDLEQRVQVLERIATDRSTDLADEIESLREATKIGSMN